MNVMNEPEKLASPNYGSFLQEDQKATCQHDETFCVNVVCKHQNYPAIQPHYFSFFKVEIYLAHILTVYL